MLPRSALDTPSVAACPLAVRGGLDGALALVPPPPQAATPTATSRSTAAPARSVMGLRFVFIEDLSVGIAASVRLGVRDRVGRSAEPLRVLRTPRFVRVEVRTA